RNHESRVPRGDGFHGTYDHRSTRSHGRKDEFLMRQTSPRLPPKDDLVNAFEFEEVAKLKLSQAVYSTIAGSDRTAFDRMTFRPRVNVPTVDMDLSVELFGSTLFTPIVVGPISDQRQYHPDGELAMVRGAAAANAAVMVSGRSSVSIGQI